MIKKTIALNRGDFAVIAAVLGGFFVLVQLVVGIVLAVGRPEDTVALCGALLPSVAVMLCLFINGAQVLATFDFLLRFGVTRRRALAGTLALMAAETAAAFGLSLLLAWVEREITSLVWLRLWPHLSVEEFAIPLPIVAALAAGVLLLGFVGGTAIQLYGRKAMWVLWAAWMVFMLGMNAVEWDILRDFTPAGVGALLAFLAALAVAAVWKLLHVSVRA